MTTPPELQPLDPKVRTLMGPGPSDVHPRILKALAAPTLGHLDPQFLGYMDDIKVLLQQVFRTDNALTFPISGTGSAGMEATMANVLEAGDRAVIGINGVFGGRMADIAGRLGCEVVRVEAPFGEVIAPERMQQAIDGKPTKLVALVHAETSTGVRQPVQDIGAMAHAVGGLFLIDTVTSLGGIDVAIDAWGVDLAYSGTQKCLACPPGLAPVTFSERAVEVIRNRKSKCVSWYLDASMLLNYWGGERVYHHTAPINMLYGLREALQIIVEEGLPQVHARHLRNHRALVAGVEAMGLSMLVPEAHRLPQLNAVNIPAGADDASVRGALLRDYSLEIGGGLGALKGKVWRVGLMGHGASRRNVLLFLAALEAVLGQQGVAIDRGKGLAAAEASWAS